MKKLSWRQPLTKPETVHIKCLKSIPKIKIKKFNAFTLITRNVMSWSRMQAHQRWFTRRIRAQSSLSSYASLPRWAAMRFDRNRINAIHVWRFAVEGCCNCMFDDPCTSRSEGQRGSHSTESRRHRGLAKTYVFRQSRDDFGDLAVQIGESNVIIHNVTNFANPLLILAAISSTALPCGRVAYTDEWL